MHKHLLITMKVMHAPKNPTWVQQFLAGLVEKIDMKIMIDPVAERCEDEGNEGVTGFVVITTSHASVHIWDTGLVQIDVFSCKHFWNQDVLDYIYGQFGDLTSIEVKSVDRTPS